ncbi:hypothetical protein [Chitinophaga sp.]|uniref:hypothetical protein n=1 Tax=Chitinophaga sp. TaxID=1869181 RepID=UPI002F951EB8
MKKSLVLCILLFHPFIACDHPATPQKKADIIHVEKITPDMDVLARYPALPFIRSTQGRYEFMDERYLQLYEIPANYMSFSMAEDQVHISSIHVNMFKKKEDVKALKDKLTKAYGQPGADSANDFSSSDDEEMLVWKNGQQSIGLSTEKNFETVVALTKEPSVQILFVTPTAINN